MSRRAKGTSRRPLSEAHRRAIRGERNGSAVLTVDQVREIKGRLLRGASTWELAGEYGVSHTAIWMIAEGRNWSWVEPGDAPAGR